jgi:isopentenyl-diphosphate delta-isomerase
VLVDDQDKPIGQEEKLKAHQLGLLHRAFSIFIFNDKSELMLQQRALDKYHCGGLWTNTVCSHQREGESTLGAAHRRLQEEMGFDTDLSELFSFTYKAPFPNGLTEHEFDHVVVGTYNLEPTINPSEAASWKWVSLPELEKDIAAHPDLYTPWMKICLPELQQKLGESGWFNK